MSKFLKVIVNLFLVFAILVAGAILVPPILGVSTTMIDSASLDTNLPVGSITYSESTSVSDIAVGDKILIEGDNSVYVYVVESADAVTGKFTVSDETGHKTEAEEHTLRNEALKVVLTVPFIGYLMIAMHSMEGLIIIGLVVLFVIILFILSELWKKSDDDEDEEDEDEAAADETVQTAVNEVAEGTEAVDSEEKSEAEEADAKSSETAASEISTEALTSDELAQAIAEALEGEEATDEMDMLTEEVEEELEDLEELQEEVSEEPEEEEELPQEEAEPTFVKVARPTLDEIIVKAETSGDKPEIISYDAFGITVVDYSDCI